jgi:predicted dehydrogenase
MGRNADEAREVVTICRDAGVTLGVVFQHRMREASRKGAQLIAATIWVRSAWSRFRCRGGASKAIMTSRVGAPMPAMAAAS